MLSLRTLSALLALVLASACNGQVLSAGTTEPPENGPGGNGTSAKSASALFTHDGVFEAITMDATDIYLSTNESVYRIARDGSRAPVVIAPTMTRYASSMVVDETNVYWTALESGVNGGSIFTTPKAGGAAILLASQQARPVSIAVDETHVYWTNEGANGAGQPYGDGALMSAPKAGGAPTVLAGDLKLATAVALDGDGVVFKDHYTVRRIGKQGGAITTIDSRIDPFSVNSLVVANGRVFYSTTEGSIFSAPTDGSAAPRIIAPAPSWARIAVHGQVVYFNGPYEAYGSVMSVPIDGGTPQTASGPQPTYGDLIRGSAYRILVDDRNFYWTDYWVQKENGMHTAVRAVAR